MVVYVCLCVVGVSLFCFVFGVLVLVVVFLVVCCVVVMCYLCWLLCLRIDCWRVVFFCVLRSCLNVFCVLLLYGWCSLCVFEVLKLL